MAPPSGSKKLTDVRNGALLQMAEAATLGLPFEVWKTRMGRFRTESTVQAFKNIRNNAGGGFKSVSIFWRGFTPKMIESGSKGAVLLVSKEAIKDTAIAAGMTPFSAALLGGAGGGIAQVSVMGPCTYLVSFFSSPFFTIFFIYSLLSDSLNLQRILLRTNWKTMVSIIIGMGKGNGCCDW